MWHIIILSSLLVLTQATNLESFIGQTWTQVAFYPPSVYAPACIEFFFDKTAQNSDCTCTGGKKATLVEVGYFVEKVKPPGDRYPMMAIDSPNEMNLNVSCTCGSLSFPSRMGIRKITSNYYVLYERSADKAYVFAKVVPKEADLVDVLENIDDLKNKRGAIICASEVYDLKK